MRNRSIAILAALSALGLGGQVVPQVDVGMRAPISPTNPARLPAPSFGQTQRREFFSGWGGSPAGGYLKRPRGSVARDKRMARKARNRARGR